MDNNTILLIFTLLSSLLSTLLTLGKILKKSKCKSSCFKCFEFEQEIENFNINESNGKEGKDKVKEV